MSLSVFWDLCLQGARREPGQRIGVTLPDADWQELREDPDTHIPADEDLTAGMLRLYGIYVRRASCMTDRRDAS